MDAIKRKEEERRGSVIGRKVGGGKMRGSKRRREG